MKKIILTLLTFGFMISFYSCKKDKNDRYDIPTTYNFSGASYSGQTTRLSMLTEMADTMKLGNTTGVVLNAQKLKDMFSNTGNPFGNTALNGSGKQLKDKTFPTEQTNFESYMDLLAAASQSSQAGSNGTAGVVTSGTKKYLSDANGFIYYQIIDKGLLGALIYYQITAVYLSEDKVGAQVALADRQRYWDEAFGYFGVPIDFPANTTGIKYIGKYANDRNAVLGTNAVIMDAYLKGRAAINNADNATVNSQVAIIRDNLENVIAATVVSYINQSLTNAGDNALRNNSLSEALAFTRALKYNPAKKISDTQIQQLESYYGTNFYTVSLTDLQAAKTLLSSVYSFDAIKDQL